MTLQAHAQIGLPFCPAITKRMAKRHWRLVEAKRKLDKLGIRSSYLSTNSIHVYPRYWFDGYVNRDRSGFVLRVEVTDLPGIAWTIDHFVVWSLSFNHTFSLVATGNDELFKKLVHFSVLKSSEI